MTKDIIEGLYVDFVISNNKLPTYNDLGDIGVSRSTIRNAYGNLSRMHEEMSKLLPHDKVFTVNSLFDGSRSVLSDGGPMRYIITTAVADSPAHKGFIEAMKVYAEHNDARIVIMPCESKTNTFENRTATFDPVFSQEGFLFVTEDTKLNSNVSLCSIQVSANQIKPITGLQRLGVRDGSYVFASPKQFLEFIPTVMRGNNFSIMTPGACTLPTYMKTNKFVSKRLAYIAEHDHTIGAIIIEVQDDKYFHFRQVQADGGGSFIDLGTKYNPDGSIEYDQSMAIVLGDVHGVQVDEKVVQAFKDQVADYNIDALVIHDLFDGMSVSHHIRNSGPRSARPYTTIVSEAIKTREVLDNIVDVAPNSDIVVVKSNHDEFLDRYLDEHRFIDDDVNYRHALNLAGVKYDNQEDVLEHVLTSKTLGQEEINYDCKFLKRDESFQYGGVELGSHGDLGINGGAASLNSLEKVYGACVTGHSHTAAIQRSVFRVGTFSKLCMEYNRGPSSWTQTFCIVYQNGSRQLLNYINGRFASD